MFDTTEFNVQKIMHIKSGKSSEDTKFPVSVSYSPMIYSNELFVYLEGESETCIGSKKLHVTKNSVVSIPKGKYSRYDVTVFKPTFYVDIIYQSDVPPSDNVEIIGSLSDRTAALFMKADNLWTHKKTGYYTKAMSVLYEIINNIELKNREYANSETFSKLIPSEEYLFANYLSRDFDYNEMSKRSGFSYAHFKKLFIKKYGCPPVKQVTDMKMKYARELLSVGKYSINEIADLCGFESACYFSVSFKKIHGVSPLAFSKNVIEPGIKN